MTQITIDPYAFAAGDEVTFRATFALAADPGVVSQDAVLVRYVESELFVYIKEGGNKVYSYN